jgi:hypothetical protein
LNLFTNYVNVVFNVPVDFPGVKPDCALRLRRDCAEFGLMSREAESQ